MSAAHSDKIDWAADSETLFYVTLDEVLRPYKVWRHKLNNEQSDDECLYHEQNEEYFLDLDKSESKQYIFVYTRTR